MDIDYLVYLKIVQRKTTLVRKSTVKKVISFTNRRKNRVNFYLLENLFFTHLSRNVIWYERDRGYNLHQRWCLIPDTKSQRSEPL